MRWADSKTLLTDNSISGLLFQGTNLSWDGHSLFSADHLQHGSPGRSIPSSGERERKKEKRTIESICLHEEIGENEKKNYGFIP